MQRIVFQNLLPPLAQGFVVLVVDIHVDDFDLGFTIRQDIGDNPVFDLVILRLY